MFKKEIDFKGTVIEYSGSDTKVERINCTERIEEELILQVEAEALMSFTAVFEWIYFISSKNCLFLTYWHFVQVSVRAK